MLQMRRSRLFAELRTYFESGRGCFAKASTVVIMRACSSTVEQGTHNPLVVGSNPAGPTNHLARACFKMTPITPDAKPALACLPDSIEKKFKLGVAKQERCEYYSFSRLRRKQVGV